MTLASPPPPHHDFQWHRSPTPALQHTGTSPCSRGPSQHLGSERFPTTTPESDATSQPGATPFAGGRWATPFQHSPKHTRWKSCKGLGGNKGLMNPQAPLHLVSHGRSAGPPATVPIEQVGQSASFKKPTERNFQHPKFLSSWPEAGARPQHLLKGVPIDLKTLILTE